MSIPLSLAAMVWRMVHRGMMLTDFQAYLLLTILQKQRTTGFEAKSLI